MVLKMEKLPEDVILLVLCFAAGPCDHESSSNVHAPAKGQKQDIDLFSAHRGEGLGSGHHEAFDRTRRTFRWIANLRTVNKRWKVLVDEHNASSSSGGGNRTLSSCALWFQAAKCLGLDPPEQLYSGGTYQEVCQLLFANEKEKLAAEDKAEAYRSKFFGYATTCVLQLTRPSPSHPKPEKPPVELPKEVNERVANNAKALQAFLRSVDYHHEEQRSMRLWCQSALNRYRMFLHLKQSNPTTWLVPTVDIEFCWIAHILRTGTYWEDMASLGIADPSHSLCLQSYGEIAAYSRAVEATASLWESTFGPSFPYLPEGTNTSWKVWETTSSWKYSSIQYSVTRRDPCRFFPVVGPHIINLPSSSPFASVPKVNLTSEEIEADLQWFPELANAFQEMSSNRYKVLPYSSDHDCLLERVIPSYERFLNLCLLGDLEDESFVGPPVVLDLIWHAHQLEPVRYRDDCLKLFGQEFWHHPWPNGLGVSSEVTDEFRCAWKRMYGTTMEEDWKLSIP